MGTRELLILILGLAVVAVILRGLYVALHARRTQIRLAIDKNIPQDLDLEELEMSELPNGGARIVNRSMDAVNQQNSLQNELDLGSHSESEEAVPILLDTVEIKNQDELQASEDADQPADDEIGRWSDNAGYREEDAVAAHQTFKDETYKDKTIQERSIDDGLISDGVEQPLLDDELEAIEDEHPDYEEGDESRQDPELGFDESMNGDLDDFSMTAGERIGAPESPSSGRSGGLRHKFNSANSSGEDNKDTLFSRFGRKNSAKRAGEDDSPELQQDPLFEDYEQTNQAWEEEATYSESKTLEEDLISDQTRELQSEASRETEKNGVADINQARESRRPASNGTVSDNGSRQPVEPSEVLVVNVMSRDGELFRGMDLLHVLITAGLKHGEMNIFHKHMDNDSENPIVFSVANILNPGTFDLDIMEEFTTRGVSLFLSMPSVISNTEAFEEMLRTAQQIRAALDGELRDDHRSVMTAQTIEHYRQRIHDFELRKLKAAQARS